MINISSWGNFFNKKVKEIEENKFKKGIIPRGSGLSYNNIAFGNKIINKKSKEINFLGGKKVEVSAGLTLEELIIASVKKGLFPMVVPGTKNVTIGGCIASNIHGKNHHIDGSFCDYVESLLVVDAKGEERTISADDSDFFEICGGFGIGYFIKSAVLIMDEIGDCRNFEVKKTPTDNMRESMMMLDKSESRFTVVWIDSSANNENIGRGIFIEGDWGKGKVKKTTSWEIKIPSLPSFMLSNKMTFNTMNKAYYWKNKKEYRGVEDINSFLFPLDNMKEWDKAYGKTGMIQFQAVTKDDSEVSKMMIENILRELNKTNGSSFISVLKKFGNKKVSRFFGEAMNFQVPNGYSLAIDLPATNENLRLLARLEDMTLMAEGKLYLAKIPTLFGKETSLEVMGYKKWLDKMKEKWLLKNNDLSDFFKFRNPLKKKAIIVGGNSDIMKEVLNNYKDKEFEKIQIIVRKNNFSNEQIAEFKRIACKYEIKILDISKENEVISFIKNTQWEDYNQIFYASGIMDSQTVNMKEIIQVNQLSPITLFEAFIKRSEDIGLSKSIVYFSSVTTMRGKGSTLFYSLTKKAMEMYLEGIQTRESNIEIFIPRTGFVETKMTKGLNLPKILTISKKVAGSKIYNAIKNNKTGKIQPQKRWWIAESILKNLPLFIWKKIDGK